MKDETMASTQPCECKHEAKIAMLEHRNLTILDTLNELKGKVDLILVQTTKIAVHEVYHGNHNEALARAFTRIEAMEKQLVEMNKFTNEVRGMMKMAYWLWGAMGTGLGLMALKFLFGGSN